jgi:glycosyltransferase involved in cell wall biosynthesis
MTPTAPGSRRPDASVVATFHGEGMLAHWMLKGFERVRAYCDAARLNLELVAVLDRADEATTRAVTTHRALRPGDQVLRVDNGDLGESRNDGFRAARAEHAGTMDGDDYYSENWIAAALERCRRDDAPVIVHPELVVSFGEVHAVTRVVDLSTQDFPKAGALKVHPWISCSFSHVDTYRRHPYESTRMRDTGFGYEDWHWNLETWAEGLLHVTASRTALFYRRRRGSMAAGMDAGGAVVKPGRFFDQLADSCRAEGGTSRGAAA